MDESFYEFFFKYFRCVRRTLPLVSRSRSRFPSSVLSSSLPSLSFFAAEVEVSHPPPFSFSSMFHTADAWVSGESTKKCVVLPMSLMLVLDLCIFRLNVG